MTAQTEITETTEPTLGELAETAARAAYETTQKALSRNYRDPLRDEELADAAAQIAVVEALAKAAQIAP